MSIRTENEIVGGGGRNEAEKEIAEIMENILLSCDSAEDESDIETFKDEYNNIKVYSNLKKSLYNKKP